MVERMMEELQYRYEEWKKAGGTNYTSYERDLWIEYTILRSFTERVLEKKIKVKDGKLIIVEKEN